MKMRDSNKAATDDYNQSTQCLASVFYVISGDCSYVLTTDDCASENYESMFKVVVENVRCGTLSVTCTKSVTFTLLDVEIVLVRGLSPEVRSISSGTEAAKYNILKAGIYYIIATSHGKTMEGFMHE